MEDKPSPALKQILSTAAQQAVASGCEFISSVHLLRALLLSEHCPALSISREEILRMLQPLSDDNGLAESLNKTLPATLDDNARLCLDAAARLAVSTKSEMTGPHHLLAVLGMEQSG